MSTALFQIEEPVAQRPSRASGGAGIGIDLGTTHSLVALASHGAAPRTLADAEGRKLLPSVVSYANDLPTVGYEARAQQVSNPAQIISSVKRFMGRPAQEIDFVHPYKVASPRASGSGVIRFEVGRGREVTPIEVSAEILRVLKRQAEQELDRPIAGAVITVPAYFDDAQRQATKDAGRIAGLEVYRLLAEPTAAALAYGLDRGGEGIFAVYDLGGGTFDISILRLRAGVFQVLATGGDSALGGDDFDRALAAHLLVRAGVAHPTAFQHEEARMLARAAKETLSTSPSTSVTLTLSPLTDYEVSRSMLEHEIESIARRTLDPCRRALKDAGIRAAELDGVVLVGGSTRTPLIRRLVESTFRHEPLTDIDPDEVVALGAAIQADILSGSQRPGVTLLDVVPLSLGIETMGGIVETIISRNSPIPISARQVFTNYSEQQTGMVVHVVQGERELVKDCRSLARMELKGIPRLPPSMARVEVSFQLDADALLTVTARELMTGTKQSVEVKPTYGLTEDEVDALVMDSLDHAEDDFAARNLAEARVELDRVVLAVRSSLSEAGDDPELLTPDERASIETALIEADDAMARTATPTEDIIATSAPVGREANASFPQIQTNLQRIRERLEAVSEPFARRRMEQALRAGMSGKSVTEIEGSLDEGATLDERRGSHQPRLPSQ